MIGIYKITNIVTGKYYIGQSGRLENRLSNHKKIVFMPTHKQYNDDLYKDIREYGIENFEFEILEKIDITKQEEKWIQQELLKNSNTYNRNLYPYTDRGNNASRMLCDQQIEYIIRLLKENKISNIRIAKEINCCTATIDDINNGKSYRQDNMSYPIRIFAKSIGENNSNSKYSENEVMELRKQYVHKSIRQLYEESDKRIVYRSFERILIGGTYDHLPVYKKREKQWILSDKLYRLEP